jgi:hypothetical protein
MPRPPQTQCTIGAARVKLCIDIDHERTYKLCMNLVLYIFTVTNMATIKIFEIISVKFHVVGICITGQYAQK